jgi:hypothetical protein
MIAGSIVTTRTGIDAIIAVTTAAMTDVMTIIAMITTTGVTTERMMR